MVKEIDEYTAEPNLPEGENPNNWWATQDHIAYCPSIMHCKYNITSRVPAGLVQGHGDGSKASTS